MHREAAESSEQDPSISNILGTSPEINNNMEGALLTSFSSKKTMHPVRHSCCNVLYFKLISKKVDAIYIVFCKEAYGNKISCTKESNVY